MPVNTLTCSWELLYGRHSKENTVMVPKRFEHYLFNDNDYLPEHYEVADKEREELIRQLAGKPKNVRDDDPDFWLLDKVLTTEEVKFMLSFQKKRTVKLTVAEMAERNKMSEAEAEQIAEGICSKGLMEFDRENDRHEKQYFIPKWVVGSGEYMLMTGKLMKEHPEIATFFHYASMVPVGKVAHMVPEGGGLGMHVIPVEKAIENNSQAVTKEKLSYWLNKYDKYALDVCSCRRQQRIRGEGKIVGICNCSATICNAIKTSQLFNTPNMSASAYRAHVDHNKCVACGKCVEICPVRRCLSTAALRSPITRIRKPASGRITGFISTEAECPALRTF